MDEDTERLRDVFVDVTGQETATESQREDRGSLLERGDRRERVADLLAEMDDRFGFEVDVSIDRRCDLVEAYYEGDDDAAIADRLDLSEGTVRRARVETHLLREADHDADVDTDRVREADPADLAAELGVDEATVEHYRRALAARDRMVRVNERYREAFDELLADRDLSRRHARPVREDGLREATEDSESDLPF